MLRFPNAKINLGLSILSRRPDGYHDIDTVFYPIPVRDALEIVESADADASLHVSGNAIDCPAEKNLAMRAYRLLQAEYGLPPVDIFLHKAIPDGAGLGGGSADAAFVLVMLRDMYRLPLTDADLMTRAATLGADCAFFVANRPMRAVGIGYELTPIEVSLAGYALLLVKPDVYVSTRDAYAAVVPHVPELSVADAVALSVEQWQGRLVNDFEASVFAKFPVIADVKAAMLDAGALYAAMSGSGSSVFGIFADAERANLAAKSYENAFVLTL